MCRPNREMTTTTIDKTKAAVKLELQPRRSKAEIRIPKTATRGFQSCTVKMSNCYWSKATGKGGCGNLNKYLYNTIYNIVPIYYIIYVASYNNNIYLTLRYY